MWASIHLLQPADTFMFHGRVMYRHLKEQKLALFTSFGGEKEKFHRRVGSFQGYRARCAPSSTGMSFKVRVLRHYCEPFLLCFFYFI